MEAGFCGRDRADRRQRQYAIGKQSNDSEAARFQLARIQLVLSQPGEKKWKGENRIAEMVIHSIVDQDCYDLSSCREAQSSPSSQLAWCAM